MRNQKPPSLHDASVEAGAVIEDWVTAEVFCERFPNIPEKTVRWQLTTRHRNGLNQYVQVIGKKRFISIKGYAKWLQDDRGQELVV